MTSEELIEALGLRPHPKEGGFFRETYRSKGSYEPGDPFAGTRAHGTAIYYLLTATTLSALHRLPGDEIFHFYLGSPVEMLMLHSDGEGETVVLGPDVPGMKVQHVVPGGTWQGAKLRAGGDWALLGTTMAPGFDYGDYVEGTADLLEAYPAHAETIRALLTSP